MLTYLRAHFQDWQVFKKAQKIPFDIPSEAQRTSGSSSVTTDQRHRDVVSREPDVRVLSPLETTDASDYGNSDINTHTDTNGE
jgi:hypothetical protein